MLENHGCMEQQHAPNTFIKTSQNRVNIRYNSQMKATENNNRYMPFKNISHFEKQNKQQERDPNINNIFPENAFSCKRLNPDNEEEKETFKRKSQYNHDISEKLYENGLLSQPLPMSHLTRTKNQMELSNKMKIEDKEIMKEDKHKKGQDFDKTSITKNQNNNDEKIFIELENDFKYGDNSNNRLGKRYFGSNSTANIYAEYTHKQYQASNSLSRQQNINYLSCQGYEQTKENNYLKEPTQLIQKELTNKQRTNSIATIFQRQITTPSDFSERNEIPSTSMKQNTFKIDYSSSQVSDEFKQQNEPVSLKDNETILNIVKHSQTKLFRQSDSIDTLTSEVVDLTTFRTVDIPISQTNNSSEQLSAASPQEPTIIESNSEIIEQFQQIENISNITPTKSPYSSSLVRSETDKFKSSPQNFHTKPMKSNSHHVQQQCSSLIHKSSEKKSNFHSIHSVPTSVSQTDMNCLLDESREIPIQMIKQQKETQNISINKEIKNQYDNNSMVNNRSSQKQKQSDFDLSTSFNFISEKTKIFNKISGSYSYNPKDTSDLVKKIQRGTSSLQKKAINLAPEKATLCQKSRDLSQTKKIGEKKNAEAIQTRSKSPLVTKITKMNAHIWKIEEQENTKEEKVLNKNRELVVQKGINLMRSSSTAQTRKRETANGKEEGDKFTPSHNSTFNFKPQYFTQLPHEDITNFLRKSDCKTQSKY